MTEETLRKTVARWIYKGEKTTSEIRAFIQETRKENLKKALQSGWTLSNI